MAVEEYLEILKGRRNNYIDNYNTTGDVDWLHEAMNVLEMIEKLEYETTT